jgi:asparagine synthase (glutamine-hydrolysing)
MLYYLALIWDTTDPEKCAAADRLLHRFQRLSPQWRVACEREGLVALYTVTPGPTVDQPYVLANDNGVVFGRLFERGYVAESMPSRLVLDERRTSEIVGSEGRTLVERYWGRYVAFVTDQGQRRPWVLRDPTGAVHCLTVTTQGVDVYFQRFEDCERLGLPPLSINRSYLCGRLAYDAISRRESGLNEISMVLPGERILHRGAQKDRAFLWDALDFVASADIEDPAEAMRLTRETARACVHAWASCFDGILLWLSGGLDSTIVLACLGGAPTQPKVICVNDYSPGSNSDERQFARLAAQRAGRPLVERLRQTNVDLSLLTSVPRNPYPMRACVDLKTAAEEAAFAAENGLVAQFNGDGGDELFHRSSRLPPSTDFAYQHGLRPSLLRLALHDATFLHTSFWHVLKVAAAYGIKRRPWQAGEFLRDGFRPLLNPEVAREARLDPDLIYPTFQRSPSLPPLKIDFAYGLTLHSIDTHNPLSLDSGPVNVAPLVSQPLIELSLRIPTYILTLHGRDRSIARYAFEQDIPPQIALRKTKGGVEEFVKDLLARNAVLIRDLLMDGVLVQEGYLDKSKLERVLSGGPTDINSYSAELMSYLDVEAWARNWYDVRRRVAA